MTDAFVLGGGVAGLAAAFGLCERGHRVRLLEMHRWLGGRACSFRDRRTGGWFDNGPHVQLGCYRAMRALLRRFDGERQFDAAPALRLAYRTADGRAAALALPRLPAPLAMPWALCRLPLGAGGRLRALRGLAAVLRRAPADSTLQRWLEQKRQLGAPQRFLWQPMCRAIMNAEPDAVSAELLLATLREAFTGSAAAAAFWIPKRPWAEILGPAGTALQRAGAAVQLQATVRALHCENSAVTALLLADGERVPVPAGAPVVSALPWHALARLCGEPVPPFAALAGSPIVSIYFELADRAAAPADEGPVTCLVDGDPFHFLCRTPGEPPQRFALLSGGNRAFDGMPVAAIESAARAQLARHYPGFDAAAPAQVRVSKEARATFVGAPAALPLRPRPGRVPGLPRNLLVCGDWTECGLPSTLEGAARSAELLLAGLADGG